MLDGNGGGIRAGGDGIDCGDCERGGEQSGEAKVHDGGPT
jgi:hypothetical protein